MEEQAYRPLAPEERATLDFLLTDAVAAVNVLRAQASVALARRSCNCGCPTIDLRVARDAPAWRPSPPVDRIVGSAFSQPGSKRALLLLHVLHGRLTTLEIVDLDGTGSQAPFPPVSSWQAPNVGPGPQTYVWPDDLG